MRGILCIIITNLNGMTTKPCLTIPFDILTIHSPSLTKNLRKIFFIYTAELEIHISNTSDKETSLLDLNIQVCRTDVHTSVNNLQKRDHFGFPIVLFPRLSGDASRLKLYCIYISQMVR